MRFSTCSKEHEWLPITWDRNKNSLQRTRNPSVYSVSEGLNKDDPAPKGRWIGEILRPKIMSFDHMLRTPRLPDRVKKGARRQVDLGILKRCKSSSIAQGPAR